MLNMVRKTIILRHTMLDPVGVENIYDTPIPRKKQSVEIIAEDIITVLNLLQTLIDESVGKIIRLDIKSAPIILIPITMVMDVSAAMSIL